MRTPPDQPLSRPLPAPGTPRAPAAAGTETELYDDPGWNNYVGGTCTSVSPNAADIQGTFTLHGAMIVEGEVDGTGTYNAVYDPCVFAAIGEGTDFDQYGPIAGSWNDSIR
ncbi:hypothetical protein [Immundisolibacter cernigliae]|uniref:hypothetical protein n=1 Tax=Immundisolibacter cernigliae TaxID=1810504 RepID=UPI0011AB2E53|nr:hypothetical protein [Immundisolibacter cernigliae]